MSDSLTIFGADYTNVTGIKATGTGNGTLTYIRPTGTKSITENGTGIDVASYASVDVAVEGGPDWPVFTSNDEATTITCDKTYAECRALIQDGVTGAVLNTPSLSAPLTAMRVEDGEVTTTVLRYVFIFNGIPQTQVNYANDGTITIQQGVDTVTTLTVTTNGTYTPSNYEVWNEVTVNVPSSTPTLQSKTATPAESQQTVSPDSGYDGLSQVTVDAIPSTYVGSGITQRTSSDLTLVSGRDGRSVKAPAGYYAANGLYNLENGFATVSDVSVTANPSISIGSSGLVTATASASQEVGAEVTQGYIDAAGWDAGTVTVSGSSTLQLDTQAATTITPSTSQQTAVEAGKYTTGAVTVAAIPSQYIVPSGTKAITGAGTTDVTNYASASVASGGATASATKGSVSNHSVTVTPSVTRTAGWVGAGTSNGTAVTVSASELVSGSQTITDNGTVNVTNLASVTVALDFVEYHVSTSAPTSSQGSDGDVWLVTS